MNFMELFRIRSPSILWTLIFFLGEYWLGTVGGNLWARERMRTCAKASGFVGATEQTDGSKKLWEGFESNIWSPR
ncbi:hypothetical protein B9Z19DRAFT_1071243 [Tuber borchii]|uniref:Uncharacterized protein n=1 Tax=Tuber borchii TaxID=42251 RepID=A0A2T7A8E9_TUBBO|nr:hypothetical protein B9Z19DRAFT_1071243 [Tuber borchii]